MIPQDSRSTKADFYMRDSCVTEGLFEIYAFDIIDPSKEKLIYQKFNQLQRLGSWIIAERMIGTYTKPIPFPYKIRASAVGYAKTGMGDKLGKAIPADSQILPGIAGHPEYTVDNDEFELRYSENSYVRQYMEGRGLFTHTPPIINVLEQEIGSFYHFAFYSKPAKKQEETMIAYMYVDKGISYPEGVGIRVVWKIFIN